MSDPNPYESPLADMEGSPRMRKNKPGKFWKAMVVSAVLSVSGVLLGLIIREFLGFSGLISQAIFQAGGVGLTIYIGLAIIKKVDPNAWE